MKYRIDDNQHLDQVDIGTSPDFEDSLNGLKLPPHVVDHIDEELCNFLTDWGYEYLYGNKIEGMTGMFINRYTLPR